ncbi:hypothetical protein BSPA14S_H0008 (plasmid) [Borreliella spielmanii A14S]|uniref:Uncharacterized protein n=1 Tax=Borreliella spielmanii A14S TaxID=498742 RepID=C0RCD4_9SPIR|nr:hypothetical protein BSPA14S_H0008 [Borreliella spielmanii A14S]
MTVLVEPKKLSWDGVKQEAISIIFDFRNSSSLLVFQYPTHF